MSGVNLDLIRAVHSVMVREQAGLRALDHNLQVAQKGLAEAILFKAVQKDDELKKALAAVMDRLGVAIMVARGSQQVTEGEANLVKLVNSLLKSEKAITAPPPEATVPTPAAPPELDLP